MFKTYVTLSPESARKGDTKGFDGSMKGNFVSRAV